jgi:hypothetical protein
MFANDPEIFYLHKNQRFIKKLDTSQAEIKEEKIRLKSKQIA